MQSVKVQLHQQSSLPKQTFLCLTIWGLTMVSWGPPHINTLSSFSFFHLNFINVYLKPDPPVTVEASAASKQTDEGAETGREPKFKKEKILLGFLIFQYLFGFTFLSLETKTNLLFSANRRLLAAARTQSLFVPLHLLQEIALFSIFFSVKARVSGYPNSRRQLHKEDRFSLWEVLTVNSRVSFGSRAC